MKEVYMKIGRMVHRRGKLTLDWKHGTYIQEVTAETHVLLPHGPSHIKPANSLFIPSSGCSLPPSIFQE